MIETYPRLLAYFSTIQPHSSNCYLFIFKQWHTMQGTLYFNVEKKIPFM